ncbi:hypothetical protein SEA_VALENTINIPUFF_94 [Microbacterium phage ValentiniPuff]|uniref:Uncharacterized protein n=1 Tax=Microbacterium phage ValentiniPuff TaxID=2315705 RepID=A0A386KP66_9CAUD|nr:hypothetical protein SEA_VALENTINIPUFF_94 [Microbacterium phage ValentiniPuff]
MTTTTKPRAVVERPDSVTHFVCPSAQINSGDANATHHLIPRPLTGPSRTMRCSACGKTEAQLRREVGL